MGARERLEAMPVIGTALAVQERYKADGADPFAAAIGFFAFLSLFPLLLLAVSVAGFVLDDPEDQLTVADTITEAIPGFDATLQQGDDATEVSTLVEGVVEQRGTIGLVGGVFLLLSGLRVVNGAMIATRVVFRGQVPKGLMVTVRQVGALVGLGALALLGVAGSSLAGIGIGQLPAVVSIVASVVITFAFDVVLFLGAYTLLSPTSSLRMRQLVPGAVLAAAGWTALKVAGASYVGNQIDSANALYGALGGVIALMLLLYLAGRLYLYGAELTAVQAERRFGPLGADGAATPPADAHRPGTSEGSRVTATTASGASSGPPRPPRPTIARRAVDPGPSLSAGSIGAGTRVGLDDDEHRRSGVDERDAAADLRATVAFGLGLAALAAGYRWLTSDTGSSRYGRFGP